MIGLESLQRVLNLLGGLRLRAAIDLGHQEDFVPVPVPQRLAHSNLAAAVMVVPGVVHERDATIHRRSDQADPLLFAARPPDVMTASPTSDTCSPVLPSARVEHVAFTD